MQIGVISLMLKTFFVEGIGSPQLEYTICSCAARLAQAQGLHKSVQCGYEIDAGASADQRRVFWQVYCLDKNISLRNGRPSVRDSTFSYTFPYINLGHRR